MAKPAHSARTRWVALLCAALLLFCALPVSASSTAANAVADGIDVSKWQGAVDWSKVAAAGIDYAILRIGTSDGMDTFFLNNYYGAKLAGIDVGVYLYTTAVDEAGAKADADLVVNWLKDKRLEYPVYFDIEDDNQDNLPTAKRTAMVMAFCNRMKECGYLAGVYASQSWLNYRLDPNVIGAVHELWMAAWTPSGTPSRDYSSSYGMWQYTDKGSVSGISGAVDRNVSYRDYPAIVKAKKLNGYNKTNLPKEEYPAGRYAVTATALHVRSSPSAQASSLGTLAKNAEISVLSTENGWGKITYQNKTGYISLTYTRILSVKGNASATAKCGDLNNDGIVNLADAITLSRTLAGWKGYEITNDLLPYADINNDGSVSLPDAILLSRHLAGWNGYETLPIS